MHYQEAYIKNGGFPETINKTDSERKIILTNVHNDILSRDVSSKFGASYDIVKKISYHLSSNIANEFSYRSIANSTGYSVETIEKYLDFLKESFMLLTLDFFSYKTKIQFKQNKKAYYIDTGLRNAVSLRFSEDIGRLAENAVFIELKRRGKEVYYWKNKAGKEIDFLAWASTYLKLFRPFTAFCRVLDVSSFELLQKQPTTQIDTNYESAFLGAIIGEMNGLLANGELK